MASLHTAILVCTIAAAGAAVGPVNQGKGPAAATEAEAKRKPSTNGGVLRGKPVNSHVNQGAVAAVNTTPPKTPLVTQDKKVATKFQATSISAAHAEGVGANASSSSSNSSASNSSATNASATNASAAKVKVEVFYETLCPYCQNFITTALASAWGDEELRSRMDIHFYPYGNAMTIPKANVSAGYRYWHAELNNDGFEYVFPCQHGPDECFGNHLQACAIQALGTQENYVPFIMCMEGNDTVSQEMSSFECAKTLGIDLDAVKACVQGKDGNALMRTIGETTEGLKPPAGPKEYVPWITLNGVHSDKSELDGEPGSKGHFVAELCKLFEEPLPSACATAMKSAAPGKQHPLALLVGAFAAAAAAMVSTL